LCASLSLPHFRSSLADAASRSLGVGLAGVIFITAERSGLGEHRASGDGLLSVAALVEHDSVDSLRWIEGAVREHGLATCRRLGWWWSHNVDGVGRNWDRLNGHCRLDGCLRRAPGGCQGEKQEPSKADIGGECTRHEVLH
jgi:hypothetical protein